MVPNQEHSLCHSRLGPPALPSVWFTLFSCILAPRPQLEAMSKGAWGLMNQKTR